MEALLGSCVLFSEGCLARVQNALLTENPYEERSRFSEVWLAGWSSADAEGGTFP